MNTFDGTFATLFVRNRHLLVLTITIVLVAGLSALTNLPRIEDPRITTRNATIITPLPGASAQRIEALVTKPIEDRLKTLSEIKHLDSTSRGGISVITVELQDWVGPGENQQIFSKIRDQLADVQPQLPAGAGLPQFDDKRGAVAYSMILALTWSNPDLPPLGILNRLAEDLADRLRNLPGTELVRLFGAPQEEIKVTVAPDELAALGLTAADLAGLVAAADVKRPAGLLRSPARDLRIEVAGELDSTARVAAVPLLANGTGGLVTLGDVAEVRKGWRDPPREIAYSDGRRAVLVAVRTEENIRLDHWAAQARALLAQFRTETDAAVSLEVDFDQSRYTELRLSGLGSNLLAGAAVVVLVVLIAMGWRAALIVGSALPLSAAASLFGLTLFGEQIHQMSVFGMIIAIGLLIDNAIVVTDEVRARLRDEVSAVQAAGAAVRHLFTPLFASTFTTILGFLPVFLLPGNIGDFVGPIAISVVLALTASFALSMTVIPALAALLSRPGTADSGSWWRNGLRNRPLSGWYRRVLQRALRHPLRTVGATLVLPAAGFILASTLGNQFFPPAERDQFEVQVRLPAGASVKSTARLVQAIEAEVRRQPGVESVSWVVGGSSPPVYYNQLLDQDDNPGYARGTVRTSGPEVARALVPQLQDQLSEKFPEASVLVKAFGQGPPISAPVAFRLYGPDPDILRHLGDELRAVMHLVPAITHTRASIQGGEPKLWLQADEKEARMAGLSLTDLAGQFQTALEGATGGSVLEDLESLPVRIRYGNTERISLERVGSLRLVASGDPGAWIPAEALGRLELHPELAGITRRDGERVNILEGFIRAGALPIDVTERITDRLVADGFWLPAGYRLEIAGDSAESGDAVANLLTYAPVLAVLMLATLVLSFRSVGLAAMIGAVAVLSAGLGMLSLWAAGYPLGFNPLIGSAGLVGVAINGSIVVLAAIRANPEARQGRPEAIVEVTLGATRHIVATSLTTVTGFLPLLFSGGDFWPPLAVVIAGGVGLSVSLGLLFTPALYCFATGAKGSLSEPERWNSLRPTRLALNGHRSG